MMIRAATIPIVKPTANPTFAPPLDALGLVVLVLLDEVLLPVLEVLVLVLVVPEEPELLVDPELDGPAAEVELVSA